jgi:ubiquinone/menaquinone biosynthesis C-methylase UbiE
MAEDTLMQWMASILGRDPHGAARDELDIAQTTLAIGERHPLDVWHLVLRQACGRDVLAPVGKPRAVLDIGCGTGRWARDVARQFPEARVIGFDRDVRQIDAGIEEGAWRGDDLVPPNCQLGAGNALEPFLYPDDAFDYSHLRLFSPFLPAAQVLPVLAEMRRVTGAGGWLELLDAAEFSSDNEAVQFLLDCLRQVYQYRGLMLEPGRLLEDYLRQAGLSHVRARSVTIRTDTGSSESAHRLARDLVAGMVAAAQTYVTLGIASADYVTSAVEHARDTGHPYSIRVVITAAWGSVPR